jgi:hypothetical protein
VCWLERHDSSHPYVTGYMTSFHEGSVPDQCSQAPREGTYGVASPWLRLVLNYLEVVGSSSRSFWQVFWVVFENLTDGDVHRVLLAAGTRGDREWPVVRNEILLRRALDRARWLTA